MNGPQRALIKMTMRSLTENPDDWEFSKYEAANEKLGLTVWLANRFYGTTITGEGLEVGGQGSSSEWFGGLRPWRRKVVAAVEGIAIQRLTKKLHEPV